MPNSLRSPFCLNWHNWWRLQFPSQEFSSTKVDGLSVHCVFPVNKTAITANPFEALFAAFGPVLLTPEGPNDIGKCEAEWMRVPLGSGTPTLRPIPGMCCFWCLLANWA